MTKEALKLALVALDIVKIHYTQNRHVNEAITAIKEALAQPEQDGNVCARCGGIVFDPVVAQPEQPKVRTGDCLLVGVCASEGHKIASQRTWVGLTDEEIEMIVENKRAAHWEFVRQVESILKEKNTRNGGCL